MLKIQPLHACSDRFALRFTMPRHRAGGAVLACLLAAAPAWAAGASAQDTAGIAATAPHPARALTAAALAHDPKLLPSSSAIAVTTYHYDNLRTGWNPNETVLNEYNVKSLQLQHSVPLDGQVDGQPLVVPGVNVGGVTHDVVYVATENDTVYGIDAESGTVLIKNHIGTPVPESALPLQCNNNDSHVGITSTPVIDPAAGLIYVIGYVYANNKPSYILHGLYLTSLKDRYEPRTVAATGRLANGSAYSFDPTVTRQRPALLFSQGNVYAAFGGFCDASGSRGWLLGWHTNGTMGAFGAEYLANQNTTAIDDRFLTSIWMAGFGPAADPNGSIYFATGNSETDGKSWNASLNLEESVVRYNGSLAGAQDYYTPNNASWGQVADDAVDNDVGAGGVMLLPPEPGPVPNLVVAGGKNTGVLLLNRDKLGGYGSAQLDEHNAGPCWCGPVFFNDSHDVGHVIVPGGDQATIYTLQTSPSPKLVSPVTTPAINTGEDGGFMPTVSTNGLTAGTTLLWAVSRPVDSSPGYVTLYVFNAFSGVQLYAANAGTWPVGTADANIVPTVANGRVYVGSYHQLTIFGLSTEASQASVAVPAPPPEAPLPASAPHQVTGAVTALSGATATLRLRGGQTLQADLSGAPGTLAESVRVGQTVMLRGDYTAAGAFAARVVLHAKPQSALWLRDR